MYLRYFHGAGVPSTIPGKGHTTEGTATSYAFKPYLPLRPRIDWHRLTGRPNDQPDRKLPGAVRALVLVRYVAPSGSGFSVVGFSGGGARISAGRGLLSCRVHSKVTVAARSIS